jgi:amino acid transporter
VTRTLFVIELASAVTVIFLSAVIFIKLASGTGPHGLGLTVNVLTLPNGTTLGDVGKSAVFGFLAFAGFEGAATLGEETTDPRRNIGRAIAIAVAIASVFFIFVAISQSMGFGTSAQDVRSLIAATSVYGSLAKTYLGAALGTILDLATAVCILAGIIGLAASAARIIFAMGRDAGGTPIGQTSRRTGAPGLALAIVVALALAIAVAQQLSGISAFNALFYPATIGALSIIVAYAAACLGTAVFLVRSRQPAIVPIPVLALAFLGYTFYENVAGTESPYNRFPFVVLGWLALGTVLVAANPKFVQRLRAAAGSQEDEPAINPQAENELLRTGRGRTTTRRGPASSRTTGSTPTIMPAMNEVRRQIGLYDPT